MDFSDPMILFYFFRTPFALTIIVKWPLFFYFYDFVKGDSIRHKKKFQKTALFRFHASIKQEKMKHVKGQIISTCLLESSISSKKRTKTRRTLVNKFIRSFFGRIHGLTICF